MKKGEGECLASKMGFRNQKKQWKRENILQLSLKLSLDLVMEEKILSDSALFDFPDQLSS